ncbi:DUF4007 family protein [Hymenobacter nivis]|uniref:DUF4007 family protein n=1 Tax=Hymenobacter nivis TaxID=1850093 RepID=A0A502GSF3_9BACT|nr:DUF4007 family protein [Hymenobacter nivis]TPG64625.1 DUF4007 family protein [Hymenobacter nivis]
MQTIHEYQGFGLILREVTQVLNLFGAENQVLINETGFGDNKVRGLIEYLKDFNLASTKRELTKLGEEIKKSDKRLVEDFSKWLCVYHWSAREHNPVLFYLVNCAGNAASKNGFQEAFKLWASANDIQTNYKKRYVESLISKTFNALTDTEAFEKLRLISISNDRIERPEPYGVHPLLLAYILYDNRRGRQSITITELLEEAGNIGKFFGYSANSLDNRLNDLANLGLVKRVQVANLNMVELPFNGSPLALVEKYYAEN